MSSSRAMVKIPYNFTTGMWGSFSGEKYYPATQKPTYYSPLGIYYFFSVKVGGSYYAYISRSGASSGTTLSSLVGQGVQYKISTGSWTDAGGTFTAFTEYTYTHAISSNGNGTCSASGNVVFYDTTYNSGNDVSATASPSTGYHFVNFTGDTGSATISGSTCKILNSQGRDVNVYANFAANTYTAKFNANGGSASTQTMPCTYGQSYSAPDSAGTRSGYTFVGWAKSSSATSATYGPGSSFSNLTSTNNGSVTLYAVWKETATIYYDGQGGSPGRNSDTVIIGNSVTLPSCTASDSEHTFGGWSINGTTYSAGSSYSVSGNVTAYAVQNVKRYTVTFDKQGGTGGTSSASVARNEQMPSATMPTKSGYQFAGYTGNGYTYYNASGQSQRTWGRSENGTIYAQWNPNTYTLAFNTNGGTAKSSIPNCQNGVAASTGWYDGTKAYYTFSGWCKTSGGSTIDVANGGNVTYTGISQGSTQTLHAVWARKRNTITYDHNDNTGTTQTATLDAGSTFGTMPTVSREGFDFVGWYSQAAEGGTRYTSSSTVPDSTATTLYAHWSEKGYDIDFDLGGAARSPLHVSYDSIGELEAPTRTNYIFKGWKLVDSLGILSSDARWGNTSATSETIPTNKYLIAASPASTIYIKKLTATTGGRFTMKALWQRKSYSVTISNAGETEWSAALSCTSSTSFTHFNGTAEVEVDPSSANTSIAAGGTSAAITMWAGLSYNLVTTYASASKNNSFKVLKSWNGYTATRTNTGSAAATFLTTHTMGESESSTQTWMPAYRTVTVAVDVPRGIAPNRVLSFATTDTTGTYITASASAGTGISFYQWQNVTGTAISAAAALATPVTFQVANSDVGMTAKYNIVQFSVSAAMDALSEAACPAGAVPTVQTLDQYGNEIESIDYGESVTFKITGISELFQFGGWWEEGASVVKGSTDEFTVENITADISLYAKLKAKVTLGKDIEEETPGTVSASLVLNGSEYIEAETCYAWVTIGDTYSIGCNTRNANSVFVCWYDVNTGSRDDPKDYGKTQDGIVMLNNVNLKAYVLDRAQEYYVAVYNRKTDKTYPTGLGQVTANATNISTMTEANYRRAASVMRIPLVGKTLVAKCSEYRSGVIEGETYYPEWTCKDKSGETVITYRIRFENGTWKYYRSDTQTVLSVAGTVNDESIVFSGSLTVAHSNPLKLGDQLTEAANGQYYLLTGTQRITLSIVQLGAFELLRTRRFNVTSATTPKYKDNETTVMSIVNQDFVFVVEWGTPIRYRLKASLASSGDLSKGSTHVGADAKLINRGELYESGEYEEDSVATVYANPRNGWRFFGWYNNDDFTGDPLSTESYYQFDMPGQNTTLYAKFARESIALYKWEGASQNKQMTWKSKVYALSKPCNINSVRIDSTGYSTNGQLSLRFKLASFSSPDESPRASDTLADPGIRIASQTMRKLPARRPERFFQLTVENDHEIDAIILGTSGEGLAT